MDKIYRTPLGLCFTLMFILGLTITSCKPEVPGEYIQPEEMEEILYDYHLSQAMAYRRPQGIGLNSPKGNTMAYNKRMFYLSVLKEHGVTEAEFDSSLVYYYSHADRLNKIYKRVSERMENHAVALGANVGDINKYSQLRADGDTANIWQGQTSIVLIPAPPYNRLEFKMERDSTFKRGDYFSFNFIADFIYQGGTKDAVIYMAVRYDNDSISTHTSHVSVSGFSQLRISGNDNNDIKDISGFIYLNRGNDESNTVKLMFVNQIQLIRFHKKIELSKELPEMERRDSVKVEPKDTLAKLRDGNVDTLHNSKISGVAIKAIPKQRDAKEMQKNSGK